MSRSKRSPRIAQAGTIPFRLRENNHLEVLLVSSSDGKRWVLPKGHLEGKRSHREQAIRETYEEAGVLGVPSKSPVGSFEYSKNGLDYNVELFYLRVDKELKKWPEKGYRERMWLTPKEAVRLLGRKEAAPLLEEAVEQLGTAIKRQGKVPKTRINAAYA